MNLRLVAGLAVSVALQMLLGLLAGVLLAPASPDSTAYLIALQSGAIAGLAACAGAFVAGQPFLRAALVLWAVGWLSAVLVLQRIADIGFAQAAAFNAMGIVLSGLATVGGVRLGRWLFLRGQAPRDAAPD